MPHNRVPPGRALRRFTLGSGPLKRTSDRLQQLGRILLVCVLLIGVAVALAVATAAYTQGVATAAAQAAARHQVMAELTEDAQAVESSTVSASTSASVTWRDPAGEPHRAVLSVPAGAEAGSTLLVWVDGAGDRTTRPISRGDAVYAAIGYGLVTYLAITAVALVAYRLFRGSLDRGRSRRWATEWAAVEPVWSRTVP